MSNDREFQNSERAEDQRLASPMAIWQPMKFLDVFRMHGEGMANRPDGRGLGNRFQKYWWLIPVLTYGSARLFVGPEFAFLISVHCGILAGVAAESRHHWTQSWFWWLLGVYSFIKSSALYWFTEPAVEIGMVYLPIAVFEAYLLFFAGDKIDKFLDRKSRLGSK